MPGSWANRRPRAWRCSTRSARATCRCGSGWSSTWRRLGVACSPEHVLITNGSQQALDFLAKLFVGPGDRVLAARPTYLGALQAFSAYEADYGAFPGLGGAAGAGQGAKLAYLMPDFANPSGRTLTLDERHAALAVAADSICR